MSVARSLLLSSEIPQGCSTLCLPFPLRHVRAVWPFGWLEIDISVSVTGSTVFRIWGKHKFSSLWDKCPGVHGGLYDMCTFHFYKTETCCPEWLCLFTFLPAMCGEILFLSILSHVCSCHYLCSTVKITHHMKFTILTLSPQSSVYFRHSPCCANIFKPSHLANIKLYTH